MRIGRILKFAEDVSGLDQGEFGEAVGARLGRSPVAQSQVNDYKAVRHMAPADYFLGALEEARERSGIPVEMLISR